MNQTSNGLQVCLFLKDITQKLGARNTPGNPIQGSTSSRRIGHLATIALARLFQVLQQLLTTSVHLLSLVPPDAYQDSAGKLVDLVSSARTWSSQTLTPRCGVPPMCREACLGRHSSRLRSTTMQRPEFFSLNS
eukprot:4726091-Amphidinium_carterae.1